MVGLLITAALAYWAVDDEAVLAREMRERAAHEHTATQAVEGLQQLHASLHAYVAPGQGLSFWSSRAAETFDTVRQRLTELDAALAPSGGSMADTLDAVDQLAAAERRARGYATRGELLLTSDVLFTEVRDLMAASLDQVRAARTTLLAAHDQRTASLRREQVMLAAAAIAVWLVIALLLAEPVKTVARNPEAWREELKEALAKPTPQTPDPLDAAHPLDAPAVPAAPALDVLREASEICLDLSALSDTGALAGALARAARVLDATGVIVWVAANDGRTLSPVASHGFDPKLMARIGRIQRDAANLTAAAFRDNVPRVSAPTADAPGALAVALCGPSGPVGVLSAELEPGVTPTDSTVALAAIFAAQLATLAAPLPSAPAAPDALDAPAESVAHDAPAAPASRVEEPKSAAI